MKTISVVIALLLVATGAFFIFRKDEKEQEPTTSLPPDAVILSPSEFNDRVELMKKQIRNDPAWMQKISTEMTNQFWHPCGGKSVDECVSSEAERFLINEGFYPETQA